jgi:DNA polymerase-1
MAKSLYIIDGHAQIYRSYYAPFRPLTSPSGEPTKAVHVFCASLFNLIKNRKPDYLAMALDTSDETVFRRDFFPEYKANREPMPEDLPVQKDRIISIIEAMGVPIYKEPGYEADDLMATMAELLAREDLEVFMVSKDKDLLQLVSDRVRLYDIGKDEVIDEAYMLEKKGYAPEQAVDIQTLVGDNVDNIPGIKGIGEKTAAKLIAKYGTAEAVLEHADELTPKQSQNVKAFAEQLPITRRLVTLKRDVEFEFDLGSCRFEGVDVESVQPIFHELGFTRLSDQLLAFKDDDADEKPGKAASKVETAATYHLVDDMAGLDALAKQLSRQKWFAFDTETTGLNPVEAELVGISISWSVGEAYYVPVRSAMGKALPLESVVDALKSIFENARIRKTGHNIKFDLIVLRQVGIAVAGVAFDSMIASFLLDPLRRSHGMDWLARELFDHTMIPISDLIGKGRNQITIDQVDVRHVADYAGEDADFTWRFYETLAPQLESDEIRSLFHETEMPLVQVLAEMEHNGITLDRGVLTEMSGRLGDQIIDLTNRIHAAAGRKFNIDSPKQLAEILFDEFGLRVVRKTKTGRSTDAATLETLASETDHDVLKLILEYRELTKLKSTYVDTLPTMICAKTGRIHASFHQTGAVTGRLSSSDPNLQNIPVRTEIGRRIRRAFVACDADHLLVIADYSQIELRILAHFCKDSALMDAFSSGQDIHRYVAAQVNDLAIDDVTQDQRSKAKAVNFGIIYGQTAFGLSRSLGISNAEAQAFIDMYFMRYPGIRRFIDDTIAFAKKHGHVTTILGRRRPIDGIDSRNRQQRALAERVAVNTVVQGSAADLIKRAMIDIHREIKKSGSPMKMLSQVHDELIFEVPSDSAHADAELIRAKMANALPLDVPIVVDVAIGSNWLEGKS